ncbi:MAG: FAD-binding oxidoreductase, partial [Betaproteobacteria bacterium]|nr:FAD-binding oxidoreductase [Betaproteobacteria bacterium]
AEHGEGVSVMRQIKQVLDPHNLMNPGKIFPD